MNIIHEAARDFYLQFHSQRRTNEQVFIKAVFQKVYNYKKISDKIFFIEKIIYLIKIEYNLHLKQYSSCDTAKSEYHKYYTALLFTLLEELHILLETKLPESSLNKKQRSRMNNKTFKLVNTNDKVLKEDNFFILQFLTK